MENIVDRYPFVLVENTLLLSILRSTSVEFLKKKKKKKNVKTWQRKKRIRPPWKLFFSPPDTSRPWQAFVHLGRVNGTFCVRVSRPRFCHFVAAVKLDAIRDEKKKKEKKKKKKKRERGSFRRCHGQKKGRYKPMRIAMANVQGWNTPLKPFKLVWSIQWKNYLEDSVTKIRLKNEYNGN